jgi:hypothetical protein
MKYTGQTGRPFKVRYQEHLRDFKYNNSKSGFAQHLIDNRHAMGRMEDVMEIVHITRKGRMMDTLEGLHIYEETKAGNQINDQMTVKENEIFETIIHQDPYRRRTAPQPPNG